MAPVVTWCWCSHCGVDRRLRREDEYASCSSCGKVLLQLRSDDAAAAEARRPRLHLGPRMRRTKNRAAAAADAAGGGGVAAAGEKYSRRKASSDAESNTG